MPPLSARTPRTRLAPSRRCSSVLRPSISASRPRLASGFKVLIIELALATLPLAVLELGSQGYMCISMITRERDLKAPAHAFNLKRKYSLTPLLKGVIMTLPSTTIAATYLVISCLLRRSHICGIFY
ncbi:hypothetical protein ACSBR1_039442 [Camellia fascicularis]